MNREYQEFQRRVNRINRDHSDRAPGQYVLQDDGLMVPRRRRRFRFTFPWKGLLFAFVLSILLKALMVWYLGGDVYSDRIIALLQGAQWERVAGQILMPDQLTVWLVSQYDVIAEMIANAAAE